MRSFTIIHVSTSTGHIKGSVNLHGRYKSLKPVSAAKKAFSKICGKSKIRGVCTLTVTIKETTRGSAGKEFTYKVKRVKKPVTVQHGDSPVIHKYVVKAFSLKKKSK